MEYYWDRVLAYLNGPLGWLAILLFLLFLVLIFGTFYLLKFLSKYTYIFWPVRGCCQDGNTSSRTITEVKHLELKQFSDG